MYLPSPAGKDSAPPCLRMKLMAHTVELGFSTANRQLMVKHEILLPSLSVLILNTFFSKTLQKQKTEACAVETICNCLILYPRRNWIQIKGKQLQEPFEQQLKGADRNTEKLHRNASFLSPVFSGRGKENSYFSSSVFCTARNRGNNEQRI